MVAAGREELGVDLLGLKRIGASSKEGIEGRRGGRVAARGTGEKEDMRPQRGDRAEVVREAASKSRQHMGDGRDMGWRV